PDLATASNSAITGAPPAAGNALRLANLMSNENRIRCGAFRFDGSSKIGIGAAGGAPPGVVGDGCTVIPCSPLKVPVGVATLMLSALNELMLTPSSTR